MIQKNRIDDMSMDNNFKGLGGPFNRYPNLLSFLGVYDVTGNEGPAIKCYRHLDRIRLTIDARFYFEFMKLLDEVGQRKKVKKNESGVHYEYALNDKKLVVTRYVSNDETKFRWFLITFCDPDQKIQLVIKSILEDINNKNYDGRAIAYISQIEFCIDVFLQSYDLKRVGDFVLNGITLRSSRISSFRIYRSTHYHGRLGNVRNGSKGLRCYIKKEHGSEFLRIELQTNREFIKSKGLTIAEMPILPDTIDLLNFIRFKKCLDERGLKRITQSVLAKCRPGYEDRSSKMAAYVHFRCMERHIANLMMIPPIPTERYDGQYYPVAAQIDVFRKLKRKYGFDLRHNYIFKDLGFEKKIVNNQPNRA